MLIAAATVLLLRPAAAGVEVLLVRRHPALRFMGGLWAFPGGRVDAEDDPGGVRNSEIAFRNAARRELREECGIDLPLQALELWARWITPSESERRFDTCFFAALVTVPPVITLDPGELVDHRWCTPGEALRAALDGTLPVSPPTWFMLEDLRLSSAVAPDAASMFERERGRLVPAITPRLQPTATGHDAVMPWEPEYARLPGEGEVIDAARYAQLARLAALPPRRLASAVPRRRD
jgi:8-oxo-dGTP pyrophosphatase MutT (NUDIX family)